MARSEWSRRGVLSGLSTATVGVAGCSGEYENAVSGDELITVEPVALLPDGGRLDDDWEVRDRSGYSNRAEGTYTIPSDTDLGISNFDVYVSATATIFGSIDEAEAEYDGDRGSLDTSSADYGDDGYYGDGADDTHLRFRENNLSVDLTEMEGTSDAKDPLQTIADAIMATLEERTNEEAE